MAGLARIAKMYGSIVINGKKFLWDYANDKVVPEDEMPYGSSRFRASEEARWLKEPKRNALICAARGCEGCAVCKPYNA